MFENRITLFRLFAFPIKVDWSWIIVDFLVTWSLATGYVPSAYPGLLRPTAGLSRWSALWGLFFSIVLHEVAHALVARRFSMPIKDVTLFVFGGVAHMEDEPASPKAELLVALGESGKRFVLTHGSGRILRSAGKAAQGRA